MSHDVFISYVSQDKAVADAVVQVLEGAGVPCWIAPRDVEVGNYSGSLTRAIKASRVLVLVFSEGTNASKYVLRELDLALKGNAIIVPFRIDRTPPAEDLEFYLATPHWIDASDGRIEEHLPQLVARLERVLGMGGALPPVPVDAGQDPPSDSTVGDGAAPNTTRTAMRPRLSNRAPVALAMLAVVLIGVMYGWRAVRQPTPPAAVPVAPAPKSAGPVQGLAALEGHEDSVVSLAWDLTGPRLVSASRDHSLRLWDPTAPEAEAVLSGHTGPVWDTIWSSDGQLIASASEDHSIRLWDAATGKAGPVLRGHTQPVQLIAFGPGGLLASASLDHTIRIWDSATGALQQTLIGH
ncbi:MAG TPA: TIR domain-containing protein, partial [bacterium]|nr:TIR domain-containing protein [bacterium]